MTLEASAKRDQLVESQVTVATIAEEIQGKTEKLGALEDALANMVDEASAREEMLAEARQALEAGKLELEAFMSELDDARARESKVTEKLAVARLSAVGLRDKLGSTTKDFIAAKGDAKVLDRKLASTTREVETTNCKVGAVQEAFEQVCRKVEEAEAKLQAALSEGEERLSAAEAQVEAANARALEAQRLRDDAAKASTKEITALREEARSSADRLEGSEAVSRGLTGRVVNLGPDAQERGQPAHQQGEGAQRSLIRHQAPGVRFRLWQAWGNSTSGELESSSASSPSAGSQHSISPPACARADGAGEVDSACKIHHLRGSAKTVEGAAAVSDAAADSVALARGFYFIYFFTCFFVRKRGVLPFPRVTGREARGRSMVSFAASCGEEESQKDTVFQSECA